MSLKEERGLKRVCATCSSKFYDLHRDPIVCPVCKSVYHVIDGPARAPVAGNNLDVEDDAVLDAGRGAIEFVSLDEVAATEGEDLPDIEGGDLTDAGDDTDEALDTVADEETFLEAEDEGEADVTGFSAGERPDDEV